VTAPVENDSPRVGRRRRTKAPLAVTLGLILVVGSVVGWGAAKFLIYQDDSGTNVALPKTGKLKSRTNKTSVPAQQDPALTLPHAVAVDSYTVDTMYDLAHWTQGNQYSGYIDVANVNGVALPKDGSYKFALQDVIEMKGWAGEIKVGIKLPYVIASVCGKIVGHAPVSTLRPDVAKAVHRNLDVSGWRLRIASDSLPNCANRALRVWGVAPGQTRLVLPLNGHVPISAPVQAASPVSNEAKAINFENPDPLTVKKMTPLRSLTLMVKARQLNIRTCGDAKCPITGKFRKGEWTVVKMDESAGWLLVATPERAGWVARQFVQIDG
jgi:hypothetical protein